MNTLTVKNKRLKMSPKGMITLSTAARKGLGMEIGKSKFVNVSNDGESIIINGELKKGEKSHKVSPAGLLNLKGEERDILLKGDNRHYWMKVDDDMKMVIICPSLD